MFHYCTDKHTAVMALQNGSLGNLPQKKARFVIFLPWVFDDGLGTFMGSINHYFSMTFSSLLKTYLFFINILSQQIDIVLNDQNIFCGFTIKTETQYLIPWTRLESIKTIEVKMKPSVSYLLKCKGKRLLELTIKRTWYGIVK